MMISKTLFGAMKLLSSLRPTVGFVIAKKVKNLVTSLTRNTHPKFTFGPALADEVAPEYVFLMEL